MEVAVRDKRWGRKVPRRRKDGSLKPLVFGEMDLEICKLVAPQINAQSPWAYQYLPTRYFAPLLKRGTRSTEDRVSDLAADPYSYLQLAPDQPKFNFVQQIYQLGSDGIDELKEVGYVFPKKYHYKKLPHELMAIVCAASCEIGATDHGLPITRHPLDLDFYPDWPPFKIGKTLVLFEADLDTASLESDIDASSHIAGKLQHYLKLIHDGFPGMVLFFTVRQSRMTEMIELLKKVIDKHDFPHEYAEQFGFMTINYDRFTKKPEPTGWAVTNDYQRAGKIPPFNFLKP